MQDRYAGDIGDFGKFALLRALAFDCCVGIVWYLTSGDGERNNDGKHLAYLGKPNRFKELDPILFESLLSFHGRFKDNPFLRTVEQLARCDLLKNAVYFAHGIPMDQKLRTDWTRRVTENLANCEILFLDPDNGIEGRTLTHKHVAVNEIRSLRDLKKPLIIYHHQTRMKGGAKCEAKSLAEKIREIGCEKVEIIRLRPYSSRFYVVLDHDEQISRRLADFTRRWGDRLVEVH